jgi:MFS family permease
MTLLWSYRALQAEMIVTQMVVSMTIINLLYSNIGLSQTQIGITQAIFTATVLLLNIPLGWLADRSGRKLMNIIGDGLVALGFGLYVFANSFEQVVVAEILIGLGIASSMGVDIAMQRAYCDRLKLDYAKEAARIHTIAPIAVILGMLAGGWLGSIDVRAPFMADVALFAMSMVLSFAVRDLGPRLKHGTLSSIVHITRHSLIDNKRLSARILAIASTRESTHALVWLLTPATLASNIPLWLVGASWALIRGAHMPGAMLASRTSSHSAVRRLSIPLMFGIAGTIICITLNIWLLPVGIVLLGMAAGYARSTTGPLLAEVSDASVQTTVASIASTAGQIVYIPVVIGVNWMASSHGVVAAYAANAIVFALLASITIRRVMQHP